MTRDVKPRRKDEEHQMQCAFMRWFELQYPEAFEVTAATPNGGKRDVRTAAKLKREGVKAGWPDVEIMQPTKHYPGLFIEFKIHPNKPSAVQKKVIAALKKRGYCVQVCYTLDSGIKVTKRYLNDEMVEE